MTERIRLSGFTIYLIFIFSVAVVIIPVSAGSLWIDEGISAWFASQSSFTELLTSLKYTSVAEKLMPGYVLYLWVWIKVFGFSEYSLRFSNIPFITLVLFILTKIPIRETSKVIAMLLTCFSPVIWFYTNETRYCIPIFSFSMLSLMGLLIYFYGTNKLQAIGTYLVVISLLLGSFFNISFVFILPSLAATGYYLHERTEYSYLKIRCDWSRAVLMSVPCFFVLGMYYLWIIFNGAVSRLHQANIPGSRHIAFVLYEFLGFSGLGTPRNALRESVSLISFMPYLSWLTPAVLFLSVLGIYIILYKPENNKSISSRNPYLLSFFIGFLFFYLFAFLTKFIFYSRHVIFLYPFFIFTITLFFQEILERKKNRTIAIFFIAGFLLIWIVSDIRLRFASEYLKDNYKLAVETAIKMADSHRPIYWAANPHTGTYYGLYFDTGYMSLHMPSSWKKIQKAYLAANWSREEIIENTKTLESAILVISKTDLYDKKNGWRLFIKEQMQVQRLKFDVFEIVRINFPNKQVQVVHSQR